MIYKLYYDILTCTKHAKFKVAYTSIYFSQYKSVHTYIYLSTQVYTVKGSSWITYAMVHHPTIQVHTCMPFYIHILGHHWMYWNKTKADLAWRCAQRTWWLGRQPQEMASNCNVEDMTANNSSNPAKFRYLIRKIKQRADLAWRCTVQMVIGTLTIYGCAGMRLRCHGRGRLLS